MFRQLDKDRVLNSFLASVLFSTILLFCSCSEDSTSPEPNNTTGPTILSTIPSNGASNQPISQEISVTFSKPLTTSSCNTNTFYMDQNVTGTISFSNENRTVTFSPTGDLDYSTDYTVTVKSGIQDMSGNPMGTDYSWQFTTEDAPAPVFAFPLTNGKRWLYDVYKKHGFISAQGSSETEFYGDYAVYVVDDNLQWQGRNAAALNVVELGDAGEFDMYSYVLYQGSDGVDMWTSGGWCKIVSTQSTSFSNNAFLFSGTLANPKPSDMSLVQINVPAGTFNALKTYYYFTETGQYAPQHIWDERREYFTDGVGLVASFWDILIDDKDPMAADYYREGLVQLKNIDSGPIPALYHELEPNNNFADSANTFTMPALNFGDTEINDAGSVIGGVIGNYVSPNNNGIRIINDWYRVIATSNSPVIINLIFFKYTNDLDLYVYERWQEQGVNYSQWFGKSTLSAGETELVTGNFIAGHEYYIGIQAWDTPDGRTDYWFCARETNSENLQKIKYKLSSRKQKE